MPVQSAPSQPATGERRPRSRWRALLDALRPLPPDPGTIAMERVRRFEEAAAVLEAARGVLERGWVQGTWYVVQGRSGQRPVSHSVPAYAGRDDVVGACLVGAVVHAARQADPRAGMDSWGLPLDLLWDALQEKENDGSAHVPPPYVRAVRARDLARWNDRHGRRRDDVLHLVDVAVAGAIQGAVRAAPPDRVATPAHA